MKRTLFLFALILCSCSGNRTKQLTGSWVEQKSNTDVITGIELKSGGDAERIGLESPVYDRWAYSGGKLILAGETTDTMSIASLNNDTLVLLDQGRKRVFVRRADRSDTEPFGERPVKGSPRRLRMAGADRSRIKTVGAVKRQDTPCCCPRIARNCNGAGRRQYTTHAYTHIRSARQRYKRCHRCIVSITRLGQKSDVQIRRR